MFKKKMFGWIIVLVLAGILGLWIASDYYLTPPFALPISAQKEPWAVQTGLRIAKLQDKITTVDQVILVPDTATFLAAIQEWTLQERWPILIEDQEYTPLFLHHFKPAKIVRLPAVKTPLPQGENLRKPMQRAAAAAWDASDVPSLKAKWRELGWEPPGVAIAWENDPAWPAAVALAADRGQPLAFLPGNFGTPNDSLNPKQWQRLKTEVEQAVKQTGYIYQNLADSINTITIIRSLGVKYRPNEDFKGNLAVTDGLARHSDGERWAAVGWIYGSSAHAVYQAMSAIFLQPKNAFLYDSYPKEGNWKKYEMNGAANELKKMGIQVKLIQRPQAKVQTWRQVTSGNFEFDLVFINSKGGKDKFAVGQGDAVVKDIPKLNNPAIVHLIHSWSATTPDDPETVAGRWLKNGAYLYVGSVHEPYLSAFLPPSLLARRLSHPSPFLVAARQLESEPWKITTIGDPLAILGKERRRIAQ